MSGERNPNPELDGLPVLYKLEILRFFVRGLPFGRPSWFLQGPASFLNLADLWSNSFSWMLQLVADRFYRLI